MTAATDDIGRSGRRRDMDPNVRKRDTAADPEVEPLSVETLDFTRQQDKSGLRPLRNPGKTHSAEYFAATHHGDISVQNERSGESTDFRALRRRPRSAPAGPAAARPRGAPPPRRGAMQVKVPVRIAAVRSLGRSRRGSPAASTRRSTRAPDPDAEHQQDHPSSASACVGSASATPNTDGTCGPGRIPADRTPNTSPPPLRG